MSSKRNLYKPAAQENNLPREKNRRTLAQGRLVPSANNANVQRSDLFKGNAGITAGGPMASEIVKTGMPVPILRDHRVLQPSANVISEVAYEPVLNCSGNTATESSAVTPRKNKPIVTQEKSPPSVKPTQALELSDTEDERLDFINPQRTNASTAQVIVVDASSREHNTNGDRARFAHSPVKVICHQPSKVLSDLRNTSGSLHEASRIEVDKLPSFIVSDNGCGSDQSDDVQDRSDLTTGSRDRVLRTELFPATPLVVRETAIVGSQSVPIHADESEDQREKSVATHYQALISRADRQTVSQSSTVPEDLVNKLVAKKKGPKIIASRYLQAPVTTNHPKGPMKALDRSILPMSSVASSHNFLRNQPLRRSMSYKDKPKAVATEFGSYSRDSYASANSLTNTSGNRGIGTSLKKPQHSDQSVFGSTPDLHSGSAQGRNAHSTPTADGSIFADPTAVDVSLIGPLPSLHAGSYEDDGAADRYHDSRYSVASRSHSSHGSRGSDSHHGVGGNGSYSLSLERAEKEVPVTQWDLELAYGRHIQLAFLLSKQRMSFKEQQKHSMSQIQTMQKACDKLAQRKAELDLELAQLQHLNAVEDALEIQNAGLLPIDSKLAEFRGRHNHLATALDTTRHHMPTRGIYIPDNDVQYLESIARALEESEELLGQISAMTRKDTPAMNDYARTLMTTENIVSKVIRDISQNSEFLSAVSSLTTKENSMRIQQMQLQALNTFNNIRS